MFDESNAEFNIFGVRRVPKGITFMPDKLDQNNAIFDAFRGDWIKMVLLITSMPARYYFHAWHAWSK